MIFHDARLLHHWRVGGGGVLRGARDTTRLSYSVFLQCRDGSAELPL
ncbi:MAG: hypothetical protein Ct9H300mP15_27730 [Gemmatimonadota bacterium]|nr:MAG: hypothetical protein Ct9H300mP15_27730 [Gemmatimonadota bacterium]